MHAICIPYRYGRFEEKPLTGAARTALDEIARVRAEIAQERWWKRRPLRTELNYWLGKFEEAQKASFADHVRNHGRLPLPEQTATMPAEFDAILAARRAERKRQRDANNAIPVDNWPIRQQSHKEQKHEQPHHEHV